jgi:hypothetical protein
VVNNAFEILNFLGIDKTKINTISDSEIVFNQDTPDNEMMLHLKENQIAIIHDVVCEFSGSQGSDKRKLIEANNADDFFTIGDKKFAVLVDSNISSNLNAVHYNASNAYTIAFRSEKLCKFSTSAPINFKLKGIVDLQKALIRYLLIELKKP